MRLDRNKIDLRESKGRNTVDERKKMNEEKREERDRIRWRDEGNSRGGFRK